MIQPRTHCPKLNRAGCLVDGLDQVPLHQQVLQDQNGVVNSAALFVLAAQEARLEAALQAAGSEHCTSDYLVDCFRGGCSSANCTADTYGASKPSRKKKSPEHIRIALPALIEIGRRSLGKMLDLPGSAVFMLS